MPEDSRTQDLVQRALGGDEDAWEELVTPFWSRLGVLIRTMGIHAQADIDELRQDTLERVVKALPRWDGRPFSTWLWSICRNVVRDFKRAAKRRPTVPLEPNVIDLVRQEPRAADVSAVLDVRSALRHLRKEFHIAVVLMDGFDMIEVDAARTATVFLGRRVAESTVRSWRDKGRAELREMLGDLAEPDTLSVNRDEMSGTGQQVIDLSDSKASDE